MATLNDPGTIRRLVSTPARWAVVGLSANEARPAYGVAATLQALGHDIVAVHPRVEPVHGAPALSQAEREELAADIALQVMGPGLWLLPVVALVLGLAIHRGVRPLFAIAQQVHALDTAQPAKLDAPVRFRELAATIDAIVDTFTVPKRSPPVPTMSSAIGSTASGSACSRMASRKPTISSTVSPLTRSATRNPASCASPA